MTPPEQLSAGNAWHGRMTHAGNIVGFGFGIFHVLMYEAALLRVYFRVFGPCGMACVAHARWQPVSQVLHRRHRDSCVNCLDHMLDTGRAATQVRIEGGKVVRISFQEILCTKRRLQRDSGGTK